MAHKAIHKSKLLELQPNENTFPSSWISGTIRPAPVCTVKLQKNLKTKVKSPATYNLLPSLQMKN